jgi:hypothetical protein
MRPFVKSAVAAALGGAAAFILAAGCGRREAAEVDVAPGVLFRRDGAAGVQILDVDLAESSVRPVVVAANTERQRNNVIGNAKTVREWAEQAGALGGMNAGFFGDTYDERGRRKQIVGLTLVDGRVVAPSTVVTSREGKRFVRAAVGFGPSGTPDIAWASGTARTGPLRHSEVAEPAPGTPWQVRWAVACGPRLFVRGERRVTDREERLVSPGRLSRAFVAYDVVNGRPRHLVLGRADAMEFADVADYLASYFARHHGTSARDALCLDGGPSAQIVYRDGSGLQDAEPTGVLVPTAILLVPK